MKLLLAQLMIMMCMAINAQQISGIGPFKIGTTTTSVIDSLRSKGYTFTESPDWTNMLRQKNTRSIILLTAETTGYIKNSKTKPTEELAVYNVGTIESKNATADNLILSFYKGTLCAIVSNYYQAGLQKFIRQNAGLPTDSVHRTTVSCGNLKNLVIADTISTYAGKPALRVFEARGFYYDRQCNKKGKYLFEISNPAIMKRLSKSSNSFDLIFPYLFL